ncbi:MAG: PD40 domain-containing protein, partial [Phycisphaerae bacterium]|nr:PD40 domain-containing protein [Phycisphaerae bacterium]
EIWITDAEQAGVQKFLTLGLFPDWHPSSNRILFQRSRDRGDRLFSVWTLDYTRGEATNLTEIATSPTQALINPKWSPDGEYVAFAGVSNPGFSMLDAPPESADIWIMNVKGGGLSNLTGGRFTNLMPAWGPNHSIYFVSNRGGQDNLWSVNPETAMAAALNRGGRPVIGAAANHPMQGENATTPNHPSPSHAAAPAQNKMIKASPPRAAAATSATSAPAQMEPDPAPEMANVPIDDQER